MKYFSPFDIVNTNLVVFCFLPLFFWFSKGDNQKIVSSLAYGIFFPNTLVQMNRNSSKSVSPLYSEKKKIYLLVEFFILQFRGTFFHAECMTCHRQYNSNVCGVVFNWLRNNFFCLKNWCFSFYTFSCGEISLHFKKHGQIHYQWLG